MSNAPSPFQVDEAASDEEDFFVDVAGLGTVMICLQDNMLKVIVYPLGIADRPTHMSPWMNPQAQLKCPYYDPDARSNFPSRDPFVVQVYDNTVDRWVDSKHGSGNVPAALQYSAKKVDTIGDAPVRVVSRCAAK